MWHIETDYFALFMFIVMLIKRGRRQKGTTRQDKMFAAVLWVSILSVVCDLVASEAMNAADNWWFYQISMTVYVMTVPALAVMWMCYELSVIRWEDSRRQPQRMAAVLAPYGLYLGLAASNPSTSLFFCLTEDMQYSRGPLMIPVGIGSLIGYSLVGILLALIFRRRIFPRSDMFLLMFFFFITPIAVIIQLMNPGWLIINAAYAVVYVLCDMTIEDERRNSLYRQIQKQNESLAASARRAEEAVRAKSEFFSRVSHDMRTPMNGILGLTSLALEEDDLGAVRRDLEKIRGAGEYMLSLINDTLDLQRIESGRFRLSYQMVDSSLLLENVVEMVQSTAARKGVNFQVKNKNADMETYIETDPVRLKQVFVNLLSNAIKFTPPGGEVCFEIECLHRENDVAHDLFRVRDNGVGMSADFLAHGLYKPFSQEGNAMDGLYAGSGLGLSIVKSIVDQMGGRIEAESEQGKGTTFSVWMDFRRVPQNSIQQHQRTQTDLRRQAQEGLQGKKILLCEDQALNIEIAVRLLEKVGCTVTVAHNGKEGLDTFRASAPGVYAAILMDVRMPVMDGLDAARAIRALARPDAKKIPIVAMTANAFMEDMAKSSAAGMDAHLSKPIDPQVLYSTLARLLQIPKEEN